MHVLPHLGWPWEELADALEDGVSQLLGGKADDETLVSQAGQVLDHGIGLGLQQGGSASETVSSFWGDGAAVALRGNLQPPVHLTTCHQPLPVEKQ